MLLFFKLGQYDTFHDRTVGIGLDEKIMIEIRIHQINS